MIEVQSVREKVTRIFTAVGAAFLLVAGLAALYFGSAEKHSYTSFEALPTAHADAVGCGDSAGCGGDSGGCGCGDSGCGDCGS